MRDLGSRTEMCVGSSPFRRTRNNPAVRRDSLFPMGLEPEGTRQSAGGALQPEAAFAAAKVESLQTHRKSLPPLVRGGFLRFFRDCFFRYRIFRFGLRRRFLFAVQKAGFAFRVFVDCPAIAPPEIRIRFQKALLETGKQMTIFQQWSSQSFWPSTSMHSRPPRRQSSTKPRATPSGSARF